MVIYNVGYYHWASNLHGEDLAKQYLHNIWLSGGKCMSVCKLEQILNVCGLIFYLANLVPKLCHASRVLFQGELFVMEATCYVELLSEFSWVILSGQTTANLCREKHSILYLSPSIVLNKKYISTKILSISSLSGLLYLYTCMASKKCKSHQWKACILRVSSSLHSQPHQRTGSMLLYCASFDQKWRQAKHKIHLLDSKQIIHRWCAPHGSFIFHARCQTYMPSNPSTVMSISIPRFHRQRCAPAAKMVTSLRTSQ